MIEAGLEFTSGTLPDVVSAFRTLPPDLRPLNFSADEGAAPTAANAIENQTAFEAFVRTNTAGFFLTGPGLTYSIRLAGKRPILCDCFLDATPEQALRFVTHMAAAKPAFAFACSPAEREARNRVTINQGVNRIEAWVGRDTSRYLPGLYWLTLVPKSLAERHGIALRDLAARAISGTELAGEQLLLRFYERPEDWLSRKPEMDALHTSVAGIFDLARVTPLLEGAKNFLETNAILSTWK